MRRASPRRAPRRPSARYASDRTANPASTETACPVVSASGTANAALIASMTQNATSHARIEWRRDKFVLFDHSTNGTYVRVRDEAEVLVKHESYVLRARGVLSLGEPAATSASGRIEFECCQPT